MAFARPALLVVFGWLCGLVCTVNCECLDYNALQKALTSNNTNLENLMLVFFPADSPTSTVVDIYYSISFNRASLALDEENVFRHRELREAEMDEQADDSESITLHFRWMQSSINLIVEPLDLQILSLDAFQTGIPSVDLTLDLPRDCEIAAPNENTCKGKVDNIIDGLNNLTSNMLSYAKSLKASSTDDMRYSVLFYNKSNNSTNENHNQTNQQGHCVLHGDYKAIRGMIIASAFALGLFFSLGSPTILAALSGKIYSKVTKDTQGSKVTKDTQVTKDTRESKVTKDTRGSKVTKDTRESKVTKDTQVTKDTRESKVTKDTRESKVTEHTRGHGNLLYIIWGVASVAFLASFSMLLPLIGFILYYGYKQSTSIYCWVYLGYAVFFLIATLASTGWFFGWFKRYEVTDSEDDQVVKTHMLTDFPIPDVISCCCDKNDHYRGFLIFIGGWFFTYFLTLSSFHCVFMILSAVAFPVVALSRIFFFITSFLCLSAFMSFFFKYSDKSNCRKDCTNDPKVFKKFFAYAPVVLSALLLFVCVAVIGAFYYLLSKKVEDYRHSGDILSILGKFVPSAILGIASYIGTKMMDCLEGKKKKEDDAQNDPPNENGDHPNANRGQPDADRGEPDAGRDEARRVNGSDGGQESTRSGSGDGGQETSSSSSSKEQPRHFRSESTTVVTIENPSSDEMDAEKQGSKPRSNEHPTGISPAPPPSKA